MNQKGKYDTSDLVEAQFEPGSRGRVLRNLRGITRKREMDIAETNEYYRVSDELVDVYNKDHRLTASDIQKIHRMWLGGIYAWAGKYRQVNIGKGGFHFAAAQYIPNFLGPGL